MKNRKNGKTLNAGYPLIEGRKSGVLAAICISAVVSYAAYIVFFHYSAFIWSLNFRLYPIDTYYVEWSKSFLNEHDGIELYVLYIMTFIDVLFSFILIKILDRIRDIRNYYFIFLIFLVESIVYFRTIGFNPPRNTIAGFSHYDPVFFLMIVLIPLVLCFLSGINERLKNITDILVTLLLRSEEHTSELQSRQYLVCRLLLEKKKKNNDNPADTSLVPHVHNATARCCTQTLRSRSIMPYCHPTISGGVLFVFFFFF